MKNKLSPKNFKAVIINALKILILPAIVMTIIESKTSLISETFFPRTFLVVDDEMNLSTFPQVQIIGDLPNHSTPACFNESIPIQLYLENDNNSAIFINSIDVVIADYRALQESDYLTLRGRHYTDGEFDEIFLDTIQPINPNKEKYSLKVLDPNTKKVAPSKYLQIESTLTDIYNIDLEFEEDGLYTLVFEVNYTIHGAKKTLTSNSVNILFKSITVEDHKNSELPELKDYLIASHEYNESHYTIYGNGDMFVGGNEIDSEAFIEYEDLIKRIYIEDGTTTFIEEYYPLFLDPANYRDLEIHLPATIKKIDEDVFSDIAFLYEDYPYDISYGSIVYHGTEKEWNAIEIADGNEELGKYTIMFDPQ